MSQHFLLSPEARTLSLAKVMRMTEQQAFEAFKHIRWYQNGGQPHCPKCGCLAIYAHKKRRLFECKACNAQFSITSGTIFASRKLALRDILAAIAIFVNSAKGHSALQLSRELDVQYKTAFVLAHKIREALKGKEQPLVSGVVEIDGAYFGGYVKPSNIKEDRKDRRLLANRTGKRLVVVTMRERAGNTVTDVFKSEAESVPAIQRRVAEGTLIHADESTSWDALHTRYEIKRVNHTLGYSHDGACTNQAESFFSRIRRAEVGIHHRIAGPYLNAYAAEMAWRENNRRISNGEQYLKLADAVMSRPVSRQWKGYWQRTA